MLLAPLKTRSEPATAAAEDRANPPNLRKPSSYVPTAFSSVERAQTDVGWTGGHVSEVSVAGHAMEVSSASCRSLESDASHDAVRQRRDCDL